MSGIRYRGKVFSIYNRYRSFPPARLLACQIEHRNLLETGTAPMSRIRFLMLGGFLGAGKTTAIARLARHYTGQGKRVAIVTNDQAYDLVDTHSLRAQGF